jgi:hypothetical protein
MALAYYQQPLPSSKGDKRWSDRSSLRQNSRLGAPLLDLPLLGLGMDAWSCLADQTGFETPVPPKNLRSHAELKRWLLDWIGKAHVDQVTCLFMMVYKLWLLRNDAGEWKIMEDPKAIATRAKDAVDELAFIARYSKAAKIKFVMSGLG